MESNRKTILIAEDEPINSIFLEKAVKAAMPSLNVVLAKDGQEALEYIQKNPDDVGLVLTDIRMPRMNGIELCVTVKSEMKLDIPIAAQTAFASMLEDAHDFDYLVHKPITVSDVKKLLSKYF